MGKAVLVHLFCLARTPEKRICLRFSTFQMNRLGPAGFKLLADAGLRRNKTIELLQNTISVSEITNRKLKCH